jgi:transposase
MSTLRSQKLRMLLTDRKLLQSKAIAIENDLRGTLRNFGLKVGIVGKSKFEARIKELVEKLPDLAILVEPLLIVRRALREQIVILHRRLLTIVRDDEVGRRLMTTPGVGPVVALTYRATVDVPARFGKSKSVGAVFGLTCSKYQSGEIDRSGRISRCGDEMMRIMLYEAAQSMLRSKKCSWLKAWAMQIARREILTAFGRGTRPLTPRSFQLRSSAKLFFEVLDGHSVDNRVIVPNHRQRTRQRTFGQRWLRDELRFRL